MIARLMVAGVCSLLAWQAGAAGAPVGAAVAVEAPASGGATPAAAPAMASASQSATASATAPASQSATAHATAPATASATAVAEAVDLDAGRTLFNNTAVPACAVCHTLKDAGAEGAIGPSLDALKPDAARVRTVLKTGLGVMPAYDTLTAEQIDTLSNYVAKVATGG